MNTIQPTRIMLSEPIFDEEPLHHWKWLAEAVEEVANPGTTVDFVNLKQGYRRLTSAYVRAYNTVEMVRRAYDAEKQGYDAFIVGCASDMALKEARSLVNIPIIGLTESTLIFANLLGTRFSVIATDPSYIGRIDGLIRVYGYGDKLASIRCPAGLNSPKNFAMMAGGTADQEELVQMLTSEMAEAVKRDRAEALYVAVLPTSAMLKRFKVNQVEGAPVLDMFVSGLKTAESLVALQRIYGSSVCKNGIYKASPPGWDKEIPVDRVSN
jgi:Asp/Glu/hydantoin racemase